MNPLKGDQRRSNWKSKIKGKVAISSAKSFFASFGPLKLDCIDSRLPLDCPVPKDKARPTMAKNKKQQDTQKEIQGTQSIGTQESVQMILINAEQGGII